MDWEIRDFYTKKSEWFGPTGVFPEHRERASLIERLCGRGPKRILELGAGSGGTAAAMADRGHSVVAVEFSPLRVAFARELAKPRRNLKILEPVAGSLTNGGRSRTGKRAITQIIRCYTPADFLVLLQGTGLRADLFEVDGDPLDEDAINQTMKGPLGDAERYLVRLARVSR